jgi:stage III sporulation protein SpoIIIAA
MSYRLFSEEDQEEGFQEMEGHRAIGLRLNLVKEEVLIKEVLKLGR